MSIENVERNHRSAKGVVIPGVVVRIVMVVVMEAASVTSHLERVNRKKFGNKFVWTRLYI